MRKGVFQKFYQNPQLKQILLNTRNAELAEHTNRDTYWGDGGNGTGRNMLGRILMETRALFQVSEGNRWVIRGVLLIGEIDIPLLNQLGVNFLMDLTGEQILTKQILGQTVSDKVYVYGGQIIFVNGADVQLLVEAIGKKYTCYLYGDFQAFLPRLFIQLYGIALVA